VRAEQMSEKVAAVFDSPEEAVAASAALKREGVPRASITLMSAEPIHAEVAEIEARSKGRAGLFAIAGGALGAIAAILLTVLTSRHVNIVTGGMPAVSPWPFGIIVFEMAALGAILAALGRTVYEARLLRRAAPADYGTAVADGKVVVEVDCRDRACLDAASKVLKP
jgi:uncharacterized integral membrane protein